MTEAVAQYQEALRLKPDYAEAHWNRALAWLLAGDFKQGWPEFEWRWRTKLMRGWRPSFPQPLWDGSPLCGKTILVYAEQGLGDELQFVRYAPLVKQQGGTVLLLCHAELGRILHTCAGIDDIVTEGSTLPPFDVQVPILSLPAILKTTLETIPATIPYLTADPVLAEHWRREFIRTHHSPLTTHHSPPLKIGIVWQGNLQHPDDRRRSIPLAGFAPWLESTASGFSVCKRDTEQNS